MATINDDRVRAVLLGRRAIRRVPFPGEPDREVGIRLLTDSEIDDARFAAQEHLEAVAKRRKIDLDKFLGRDAEAYDREHTRQMLWRACFDPDSDPASPHAFFPREQDVRDLDAATVTLLWDHYAELVELIDPKRSLDDDSAKELLDLLGKEPDAAVLLAQYAPATLRSFVRILISQRAT